jgi:hypothetical protein
MVKLQTTSKLDGWIDVRAGYDYRKMRDRIYSSTTLSSGSSVEKMK